MFVGLKMKNIIKTTSSLLYSFSTRETIIKNRISYCRENNEMKKNSMHLVLYYKYTYNKLSVADR